MIWLGCRFSGSASGRSTTAEPTLTYTGQPPRPTSQKRQIDEHLSPVESSRTKRREDEKERQPEDVLSEADPHRQVGEEVEQDQPDAEELMQARTRHRRRSARHCSEARLHRPATRGAASERRLRWRRCGSSSSVVTGSEAPQAFPFLDLAAPPFLERVVTLEESSYSTLP